MQLVLRNMRALNHLLEEGLVKQIGISNETPWGVNEYLKNAAETYHLELLYKMSIIY